MQLLDVGTAPKPGAINKLLTAMEFNDQIGGCCGELTVYKPNFVNGFSAAQHFEYKMNHMMDKGEHPLFPTTKAMLPRCSSSVACVDWYSNGEYLWFHQRPSRRVLCLQMGRHP